MGGWPLMGRVEDGVWRAGAEAGWAAGDAGPPALCGH